MNDKHDINSCSLKTQKQEDYKKSFKGDSNKLCD